MTRRIFFIILILLLSVATTITARDIPVIGIDMRDGLIESRIRGLCEISPGRTGILTAGSVTVTDGITFNSYTPDLNSGIPSRL